VAGELATKLAVARPAFRNLEMNLCYFSKALKPPARPPPHGHTISHRSHHAEPGPPSLLRQLQRSCPESRVDEPPVSPCLPQWPLSSRLLFSICLCQPMAQQPCSSTALSLLNDFSTPKSLGIIVAARLLSLSLSHTQTTKPNKAAAASTFGRQKKSPLSGPFSPLPQAHYFARWPTLPFGLWRGSDEDVWGPPN